MKTYGLSRVDYNNLIPTGYNHNFDRPHLRRSTMFDKEAIDQIVKRELANVPSHHTVALIAVANNEAERFAIAYKPNDEWEIQGYVEHEKKTGLGYGASVQWSR